MAKKLNASAMKAVVGKIVADSTSEVGYSVVDTEHVEQLKTTGKILVNPSIDTPAGKSAVRATDELIAEHAAQPASSEPVAKQEFEILDGLDIPESKRGGRKAEAYPFAKLAIGQSFPVYASTSHPKPEETFQSTVSSATRRFSVNDPDGKTRTTRKGETVPVLVPTRKFTMRPFPAGYKHANGYVEPKDVVRVYRTA